MSYIPADFCRQLKTGPSFSLLMHQRSDLMKNIRHHYVLGVQRYSKVTTGYHLLCEASGCLNLTRMVYRSLLTHVSVRLCSTHLDINYDSAPFITLLCINLTEQCGTDASLMELHDLVDGAARERSFDYVSKLSAR